MERIMMKKRNLAVLVSAGMLVGMCGALTGCEGDTDESSHVGEYTQSECETYAESEAKDHFASSTTVSYYLSTGQHKSGGEYVYPTKTECTEYDDYYEFRIEGYSTIGGTKYKDMTYHISVSKETGERYSERK